MTEIEIIDAEIVEPEVMSYATLEELITQADDVTLRSFKVSLELRWKSGRKMLAERQANGGKQLPHGRMAELVAETGRSERELKYRMQFAEQYPTLEKVGHALPTFGSWREITKSLVSKPKSKPADKPKGKVVDTAGNEQPAPKQEPVPVDTAEPETVSKVTQPKDEPDPHPTGRREDAHDFALRIQKELLAFYGDGVVRQELWEDSYQAVESLIDESQRIMAWIYERKFTDEQRKLFKKNHDKWFK